MSVLAPRLDEIVHARILARTGRRVKELAVELRGELVVLSGWAPSYHVKQLAQHGVQELLPAVALMNSIRVAA